MKQIRGNIWEFHNQDHWFHNQGHWVAVTTNGFVKNSGEAVMGRGTAAQAAGKYKALPRYLGSRIREHGNHVFAFENQKIITFPVKHHWVEKADLKLIRRSCHELVQIVDEKKILKVYMPRPGCGNGQLTWDVVCPEIEQHLDDRFVVIAYED